MRLPRRALGLRCADCRRAQQLGQCSWARRRRRNGADRFGGDFFRSAVECRTARLEEIKAVTKRALTCSDAAASRTDAQRAALDAAARNVAAAEAAGPNASYSRLVPQFRLLESDEGGARVEFAGTITQLGADVDILTQMIAAMNASHACESDASIFDAGRTLTKKIDFFWQSILFASTTVLKLG
jgi:flagellar basal body rod protein FlgC